jgi:hypothetical protein
MDVSAERSDVGRAIPAAIFADIAGAGMMHMVMENVVLKFSDEHRQSKVEPRHVIENNISAVRLKVVRGSCHSPVILTLHPFFAFTRDFLSSCFTPAS